MHGNSSARIEIDSDDVFADRSEIRAQIEVDGTGGGEGDDARSRSALHADHAADRQIDSALRRVRENAGRARAQRQQIAAQSDGDVAITALEVRAEPALAAHDHAAIGAQRHVIRTV